MELELRIMELMGLMFSEPLRGNGGDFICILQDTADFLPYNLIFVFTLQKKVFTLNFTHLYFFFYSSLVLSDSAHEGRAVFAAKLVNQTVKAALNAPPQHQ